MDNLTQSSILKSFQKYTKEQIPLIEKEIEINQLNLLYNYIESPLLKQELINSFKRRQLEIKFNLPD